MMSSYMKYTNRFSMSLFSTMMLGMLMSSSVFAYTLIDLGENVNPKALNNTGIVVGASNTDQYPSTAFRWSSGIGFELIDGTSSNAVNDNNQIAGSTITGAFILDGNSYQDWSDYAAFGINQSGKVAGYKVGTNPYQAASLPYNPAIYDGKHWTVFNIAGLYPRGTRLGVYADRFILNAINLSGYSVGYKYRYGIYGTSAILIDPNVTVKDLSDVVYLPTDGGIATDINDNNIIVGVNGTQQAYIYDYTMSNLTLLPLLDGGTYSRALAINEANQVVGTSETLVDTTKVYHAFIWDETNGVVDLNNMPMPAGWILTSAAAINDNGDIVGTGTFNGVSHGFMLTTGATTNQPPVAVATADVYSGRAPLVVNFDASSSTDPDGSIVNYLWDFMDGTTSTEMNPTHEFTSRGTYLVTLTVTDEQGLQASNALKITVRKPRRN